LVRFFTRAQFHQAAIVTPWIALGVMFQGVYLVGSIGLIITKRTTVYPLSTGLAAAVSLTANVLLIPRYSVLGAAWANTIAYATLAAATVGASWHYYPIRYEWSRLARIAVAGSSGYVAASRAVPVAIAPLAGLFLRTFVTVGGFLSVLYLTGFFRAGELRVLREIRHRAWQRKTIGARELDPSQVEMAGEIIATAPGAEPFEVASTADPDQPVSPDSRASPC
jgi:O-antigen/teichoic acid export membrane protein